MGRRPAPRRTALHGAALVLAVTACLAGGAAAAPPVSTSTSYMVRMDTDGDRRVSLAEFQQWMTYGFERMDRDRDGVVTTAELPGGRGRPVRLSDYRQSLAETFARQDVNRDGVLDAKELAAPPQ